ncbi:unnamed protein product [Lupinus luteus]|uniref:Uncharacterized protein n=1 Tax=Lupinus luteus TaxID=3873 RepID=A0AAV1Y729_LUPLU
MNDNINWFDRIILSPSTPPPPSPPIFSFIAALTITTLIFTCIHVFSVIVSVAILITLFITSMYLLKFINDRHEMRERNIFYGQTPENNQRVVRFFDKLFWVVEERGGDNNMREGSNKKLIGSVVRFGSQAIMHSSSGCSECAICLEDFKEGKEGEDPHTSNMYKLKSEAENEPGKLQRIDQNIFHHKDFVFVCRSTRTHSTA